MQHRVARSAVTYLSEKVATSVFTVTEQAKHHKDDTDTWRENAVTVGLSNKQENGEECKGSFSNDRVNIRNGSSELPKQEAEARSTLLPSIGSLSSPSTHWLLQLSFHLLARSVLLPPTGWLSSPSTHLLAQLSFHSLARSALLPPTNPKLSDRKKKWP
jgi:hypothetical protein